MAIRYLAHDQDGDHLMTQSPALRQPVALSEVANGLVRIAVAYTGSFEYPGKGPFKITAKDLENMRARLAEREAPIDYEHLSSVAGAPPGYTKAAGWIRKPDKITEFNHPLVPSSSEEGKREARGGGRKILWAWAEFTPVMLAMIKQKEYRYFSPEIHWSEKDEQGNGIGTVLKAAAITNRPFLKDLPPIELSDADYQQLFGLAAREDSKLPAISLSEHSQALVSLDQIHVPGPVNQEPGSGIQDSGKPKQQISVAYGQLNVGAGLVPAQSNGRPQGSPLQEGSMKNLKCRKLTDGEHKGKIGVFDGDELIGFTEGLPAEEAEEKMSELFAGEVGMPGRPLTEIALMVKRGQEAHLQGDFAALSEAIHGGHINLTEAGRMADGGRVKFSTILLAQEAEKRVSAAVRQGKVLPKNRALALRIALSDPAAFAGLVEEGRPVVDLRTHGHAGGGESTTAQQALMTEVEVYKREHKCSASVALSEVTKAKPQLWEEYSAETVAAGATECLEEEE